MADRCCRVSECVDFTTGSQPAFAAKSPQSVSVWVQPFPAAQQPPHGTPNKQPTSSELPAPTGPEYEAIGELTYQMLQFAAETCPSWSAEEFDRIQ